MRTWRVVKESFIKSAFTGEGTRLAGGRWNPKGIPVVYTASSLALAALEIRVHADEDLLPTDMAYFAVDIPDALSNEQVALNNLPSDWRAYPPPESLQDFGATGFARHTRAVLAVASAVIPEENNLLLNPLHSDFAQKSGDSPKLFQWDPRLRR
jgi:RES domain-containing protein